MTDLTIHFDLPLDTNLPATYQRVDEVTAYDSSTVTAYGSSTVTAYDAWIAAQRVGAGAR